MHLAYRWFSLLGFEREIPDHSTFSKNRHGRFRGVGVFLELFEEIVRRCLEAGRVVGGCELCVPISVATYGRACDQAEMLGASGTITTKHLGCFSSWLN